LNLLPPYLFLRRWCRVPLLFFIGRTDLCLPAFFDGLGGSGPLRGWICADSVGWVRFPAVVLGLRRLVKPIGFFRGRDDRLIRPP
jgi:hypothetical protein